MRMKLKLWTETSMRMRMSVRRGGGGFYGLERGGNEFGSEMASQLNKRDNGEEGGTTTE